MKAFNLEKALAGEPVVTRRGKPVKIAGYNPDADKQYAVIAWVEGKGRAYNIDGTIGLMELRNDDQLFMAEKTKVKREGWVRIVREFNQDKINNGVKILTPYPYSSIEACGGSFADGIIAKIEWEE